MRRSAASLLTAFRSLSFMRFQIFISSRLRPQPMQMSSFNLQTLTHGFFALSPKNHLGSTWTLPLIEAQPVGRYQLVEATTLISPTSLSIRCPRLVA